MRGVRADLQAHDEGYEPKHPAEQQQHNDGHYDVVRRFGLDDDSGPHWPGLHHLPHPQRERRGSCELHTVCKQSMFDLHN